MEHPKVQFNKNSEERRKRRSKFLFVALLLFLLLAAAAVGFLRKPDLQVTRVTVTGTQALDPADIESSARAGLSGAYLFVIPRSNVLLFSKRSLEARLLQEYPAIRDAKVLFVDRQSIRVDVTERRPDSVWCRASAECYFIDSTGMIYEPSPSFSDGVYPTYSGGTIDVPADPVRARFLPVSDFAAISGLAASLGSYPVDGYETHIDPSGDISLRVGSIKGHPVAHSALVMFTKDSQAEVLAQELDLLLADKSFLASILAHGQDLESVDLRFPEKIYYKFKNAVPVAPGSATSTHP